MTNVSELVKALEGLTIEWVIKFKIDKNGNISNARARGPHKRLEKEAIRVVNLLPKMTPGKQRGRAVSVSYTLPITLIVI